MWDYQNPSHNHYDAILLLNKSVQLLDQDRPSPTRQQIMYPVTHAFVSYRRLNIDWETYIMQQIMMQQHEYYVIDMVWI